MLQQKTRMLGGVFFVAGTSIGAGMLALPVVTAAYGFWPASIVFIASWLLMLLAALFMLEVNLWSSIEVNIISMARNTLGSWGQITTWVFYLLLLYILMAAYLSGINSMLQTFLGDFLHIKISVPGGILLLVLFSIFIIYLGIRVMDYINRLLMFGLIACYFVLTLFIAPHMQVGQLMLGSLQHVYWALPVIMCSFGFQIIVPTLRVYLQSDMQAIKRAIIIGSSIPLLVYIIWEALILGVLPLQGTNGLLAMVKSGQPAVDLTQALKQSLGNTFLASGVGCFAFFAMSTSFIGVSLSLFDFLTDGLKSWRLTYERVVVILLTVLPPALFVILYPRGFILALGYAGTVVAILLGILPALMAWRGRYVLQIPGPNDYRVPGGRASMLLVLLCSLAVIAVECFHK